MSPDRTQYLGRRAGARSPQWVRTSKWYLSVYVFLWVWMWAIALPAAVIAMVIIDRVATVEVSILQFVRNGPGTWMLFVVAIIVTTMYLPVHVANGMTRRSAIRSALFAALLGALLYSVSMTVAVLLEGVVYDALGWTHGTSGGDGAPGVWEHGALTMLIDYTFACLGGAISGLLVGIAYYRTGGWIGTLLLPLTVLPALAVTFVAGDQQRTLGSFVVPASLAQAAIGAVVLAAALAFALLARNVPIDRTEY